MNHVYLQETKTSKSMTQEQLKELKAGVAALGGYL
jgi:hypothetical protein